MRFDHTYYVPCLPWKQGEYQALFRLAPERKKKVVPLIEVPELGFDFETRMPRRTVDQLLPKFVERVAGKWKGGPFFVDFSYLSINERMHTGVHPVGFVFTGLRLNGCNHGVPVVQLDRDDAFVAAIQKVLSRNPNGACLRMTIEQAANATTQTRVDTILGELALAPEECDMILDMKAPNFVPLEGFAKVVSAVIRRTPHLRKWRTFTLIGTSFPRPDALRKGTQTIPRYEWQLYSLLARMLSTTGGRLPTFGDYAIVLPDSAPANIDWRSRNPSVRLIYTIDNAWQITKGRSFRQHPEDYAIFCKELAASAHYCSPSFSWGDEFIQKCGDHKGGTGNLTSWVQVGTSHHIAKVVDDLAKFFGAAKK